MRLNNFRRVFSVIIASVTVLTAIPVVGEQQYVDAYAAPMILEDDLYYEYNEYLDNKAIIKKYNNLVSEMENITYSRSNLSNGLSAFKNNLQDGPAKTLRKMILNMTGSDYEEIQIDKEMAAKYLEDMMSDESISKMYTNLSSTKEMFDNVKDAFEYYENEQDDKAAQQLSDVSGGYWTKNDILEMFDSCQEVKDINSVSSTTGKVLSKTKAAMSIYMVLLINKDYLDMSKKAINPNSDLYKGLTEIENEQKGGFLVSMTKEMLKKDVLEKWIDYAIDAVGTEWFGIGTVSRISFIIKSVGNVVLYGVPTLDEVYKAFLGLGNVNVLDSSLINMRENISDNYRDGNESRRDELKQNYKFLVSLYFVCVKDTYEKVCATMPLAGKKKANLMTTYSIVEDKLSYSKYIAACLKSANSKHKYTLSMRRMELSIGDTVDLKLKGTKKGDKVSWIASLDTNAVKLSNNNRKKVTVNAKKAGKGYIYCTINKKNKIKCGFIVKGSIGSDVNESEDDSDYGKYKNILNLYQSYIDGNIHLTDETKGCIIKMDNAKYPDVILSNVYFKNRTTKKSELYVRLVYYGKENGVDGVSMGSIINDGKHSEESVKIKYNKKKGRYYTYSHYKYYESKDWNSTSDSYSIEQYYSSYYNGAGAYFGIDSFSHSEGEKYSMSYDGALYGFKHFNNWQTSSGNTEAAFNEKLNAYQIEIADASDINLKSLNEIGLHRTEDITSDMGGKSQIKDDSGNYVGNDVLKQYRHFINHSFVSTLLYESTDYCGSFVNIDGDGIPELLLVRKDNGSNKKYDYIIILYINDNIVKYKTFGEIGGDDIIRDFKYDNVTGKYGCYSIDTQKSFYYGREAYYIGELSNNNYTKIEKNNGYYDEEKLENDAPLYQSSVTALEYAELMNQYNSYLTPNYKSLKEIGLGDFVTNSHVDA